MINGIILKGPGVFISKSYSIMTASLKILFVENKFFGSILKQVKYFYAVNLIKYFLIILLMWALVIFLAWLVFSEEGRADNGKRKN